MTAERVTEQTIHVTVGDATVSGDLMALDRHRGLVVFAHGSGSSRRSPRNREVAGGLAEAGFSTLLIDLLTRDEQELDALTRELRFDIDLITRRLLGAIDWAGERHEVRDKPIGIYGASTGAAAALRAAAERRGPVRAVVSRGGRVDLAADALPQVRAATLFIVGGEDRTVLDLNETALHSLTCDKRLAVVAGATHLFEEPGAMEQVTDLTRRWFDLHLVP